MALKSNINRPKQKKNKSQFTIDIDLKGLVLFLFLSLLSAVIIFYLGMVFGKATRDPNTSITKSEKSVQDSVKLESGDEQSEDKLSFFNIRDEKDSLSTLKKDFEDIDKKTDDLIEDNKIRLERSSEEEKTIEPEKIVKIKQKSAVPLEIKLEKRWPENSQSTSAKKGKLFSLQVLATRDINKAQTFVKQLQQKLFPAYVTEITIENTKIYRVRVGKEDRSSIITMKAKLEKTVSGLGKIQLVEIK
ncbi:MAG: SPOR domain-containing protein [Deltaproteobacteria bacterium]|nr:SPOR domain-containing protein [Deltaproteobacteria bacterium]